MRIHERIVKDDLACDHLGPATVALLQRAEAAEANVATLTKALHVIEQRLVAAADYEERIPPSCVSHDIPALLREIAALAAARWEQT